MLKRCEKASILRSEDHSQSRAHRRSEQTPPRDYTRRPDTPPTTLPPTRTWVSSVPPLRAGGAPTRRPQPAPLPGRRHAPARGRAAMSSDDGLRVLAPPVLARACEPACHEVVVIFLPHMLHPHTAASIALELRPCAPRLLCERLMLLRLPCPCSDTSRVLRVVPDADRSSAGACVRVSPL